MQTCLNLTRHWLITTTLLALLSGAAMARSALPDFTGLAEQGSKAVVNISTTQHSDVRDRLPQGFSMPDMPEGAFGELFERFFGDQLEEFAERETQSLGSGFIISADGYIMTNYHVVEGADEVMVKLSDRKSYPATVIGMDKPSDMALLKIEAEGLPTVKIGRASTLKVGEWVLAIGSPFGFDHTVTAGIVSAKGRSLPTENYVPFIQTDVAINPGNSGGPLFNLDGEVVGVNSQIYSRTGGFMGLSFAIPIELAMNVADQLRTEGRVTRGYLGVLIQDVDLTLAESFGLDHPRGALVARVLPDSPAAAADLQPGDIILTFNDTPLLNSSQLPPLVGSTRVNATVELKVLRNGEEREVDIVIGELPADEAAAAPAPQPPEPQRSETDRLGLTVQGLSGNERRQLGLDAGLGVRVSKVDSGPAQAAGIQSGDVLLMLGGQQIRSVDGYRELVSKLPARGTVPVLVQRDDGPLFLALRLR